MELLGQVSIPAPPEAVWAALNDSGVLRACIPGCEEVADESDLVRSVTLMVKVGPVRARFAGKVTLSEVDAPRSCVLSFEGSGGAAGMASGQSRITLTPQDEGATQLAYAVTAAVGGKLGQIGGRLIDASARSLARQFFSALRDRLAGGVAGTASTENIGGGAAAAGEALPMLPAHAASTDTLLVGDGVRLLWFSMGVLATTFGVVVGAFLFGRIG
jgi:carbon monoxide dehydrogenase subunit G